LAVKREIRKIHKNRFIIRPLKIYTL